VLIWFCGCCCAYCRVVGERWDVESWEIPELERAKTLLSQGNFSRSSFDHGRQIIQHCHMRPPREVNFTWTHLDDFSHLY
jgi:hypothetical protein